MSKAEERALEALDMYAPKGINEQVGLVYTKSAMLGMFKDGYHQAEKDLLENEHEKSWRLDEKLWKGIKDVEEASYQYMYDASNDWAYDIPTWKDVQDAFKAGSEWKEDLELTWEDIEFIVNIDKDIDNEESIIGVRNNKEHYKEVLKRFKERKEK